VSTLSNWQFDSELHQLLSRLCSEELTLVEENELLALLERDSTARDQYVVYMASLHAELMWKFEASSASLPMSTSATVVTPILSKWRRRLPSPGRFVAIAASLLLVGYFAATMGLLVIDQFERMQHPPRVGNRDGLPVAVVCNATDVQWSTNTSSKPATSSILLGEPLKIESGSMELQLNAGTKLVVEGPADWSVDGNNRVSLRAGKLMAHVPEQAIGFTVQTLSATIVDLGTEFGVEVDSTGETSVQVLEGTVEFSSSHKPARDTKTESSVRRLQAGEAAKTVAAGQAIAATEFLPQKFTRRVGHANSGGTRMVDLTTAIATQSSEYHPTILRAQMAIDGDPQTVCHTNPDDSSAWLQIDLGQSRPIAVVVLHNRPLSGGWLRDITVKVLAEDGTTVVASSPKANPKNLLGGGEEFFDDGPKQLAIDLVRTFGEPAVGRYVRIERAPCVIDDDRIKTAHRQDIGALWIPGCKHSLCISEVEVFESSR
jgi:hypothetical protein